jgi:hypothetical protein
MKELTFTILEATNCNNFTIGEKTYNIKCRANSERNYHATQKELFKTMEEITERYNNMGIAVLFEVE